MGTFYQKSLPFSANPIPLAETHFEGPGVRPALPSLKSGPSMAKRKALNKKPVLAVIVERGPLQERNLEHRNQNAVD